jgi:hypothetical protein
MFIWNGLTMWKSGKLVHPATICRPAIDDLVPWIPESHIGIPARPVRVSG